MLPFLFTGITLQEKQDLKILLLRFTGLLLPGIQAT
jgi:hypothetical protein